MIVAGRKVVGSAQLRRDGALLQHGAILLEDDQSTVTAVTLGAAPADGSAPLSRLLGRRVSREEAAGAVAAAAERHWGPARGAAGERPRSSRRPRPSSNGSARRSGPGAAPRPADVTAPPCYILWDPLRIAYPEPP